MAIVWCFGRGLVCLVRTYWVEWERSNLAPYASKSDDQELTWKKHSKFEKDDRYNNIIDPAGSISRYRTNFQINKERILDSTAFRRLEYKTQIFVNHEGDNYRTRLTHTLEVASIARRIAKAMRLNEDLVEAIALGHDLGHTPFGHAGEEALNGVLGCYGFYHNVHSLKIVDGLEEGYIWDNRDEKLGGGKGLNLTFAVRDGILKHTNKGLEHEDKAILNEKQVLEDIDKHNPTTIEGQVVALADEVAQRVNDLEDGLRSGLISKKDVMKLIRNISLEDLQCLIRAAPLGDSKRDQNAAMRRLKKYKEVIEASKEDSSNSPTIGNLIGFVKDLYIANVIEYSHDNIKKLREVGAFIKNEFDKQIVLFETGSEEQIREIKGIENVDKLEQDELKKGEEVTAKFCEITLKKEETKKKAWINIYFMTLQRNEDTEELDIIKKELIDQFETEEYLIRWIASEMAVWRTQVVLVLAKDPRKEDDNSKKFFLKKYPIEQVKIKINDNVVSFSEKMKEIDAKFKAFIEMKIHRSSKVARMNTKGNSYIKKIYKSFLDNPYQLNKNVWKRYKYGGNSQHFEGKSISDIPAEDIDHFKDDVKKDPNFKQLVADHIAGMTDRFLINEYKRMFLPSKEIEEKEERSFSE